jgi:peroxiredoxin
MPDINGLFEKVGDRNIVFLMVSVDEDFDKAKRFVSRRGFSFDIYRPATPVPSTFAGRVIPSTFVISPDGKIVMRREGMAKYNTRSFIDFLSNLN